jgi:hypothetical protein
VLYCETHIIFLHHTKKNIHTYLRTYLPIYLPGWSIKTYLPGRSIRRGSKMISTSDPFQLFETYIAKNNTPVFDSLLPQAQQTSSIFPSRCLHRYISTIGQLQTAASTQAAYCIVVFSQRDLPWACGERCGSKTLG